ncbi:hypothetical protein GQ43DRAFT_461152 [Delitschia confertaspora ATCC 74209]|uniref:Uncharacterized protein n=1 Tax=Delitschia confertaspora ATCC 74209 TaxID=1513339 RepID=A0A9P4JWQ9_9PLEO|nr:hypothetical protein GQ43DRAFT_461152 [Delitschia confertaspora ATCC 74209]
MRLLGSAACFLGIVASVRALALPELEDNGKNSTDPCILANSPTANASAQLGGWVACQINGFFPYPANPHWDTVFRQTFSPTLLATFNSTPYDYASWLSLYRSVNTTLGQTFAPFRHGFTSVVAVPNYDPFPKLSNPDFPLHSTRATSTISTISGTSLAVRPTTTSPVAVIEATPGLEPPTINVTPDPKIDRGGTVYLTGWEGGYHVLAKRELYWTDAVFVVVKDIGGGERRIVEFRESSNVPNSAVLPEPVGWGCGFEKKDEL